MAVGLSLFALLHPRPARDMGVAKPKPTITFTYMHYMIFIRVVITEHDIELRCGLVEVEALPRRLRARRLPAVPHAVRAARPARARHLDRRGGRCGCAVELDAAEERVLEGCLRRRPLGRVDGLFAKMGGNVIRVGNFLDFARLTTRTMHPMGRTCGGPGEIEKNTHP